MFYFDSNMISKFPLCLISHISLFSSNISMFTSLWYCGNIIFLNPMQVNRDYFRTKDPFKFSQRFFYIVFMDYL
ncbi:hypothetical protein BpHYR1_053921 [Brachionus plicatilis]|uniref:Uncharacterized protein n=1 Tax=Brachionus plicatilis TaxID=10195 RepID=A0A3M7QBK2_BRAPC|nr:hypothetical protein BpHYR1_053921 [Brachionus plicatilis]